MSSGEEQDEASSVEAQDAQDGLHDAIAVDDHVDPASVEALDAAPSEGLDSIGLEQLLDYLHRSRGFDFTGYKRASLARRIHRRMQTVGITTYPEYIDYLEVRPAEFPQLFNMVLINVTSFFRDAPAWEALREHLKTRLAARDGQRDGQEDSGAPFRVWCAGCASGEEAYTISMVLAELLGPERYNASVKIYATDLDDEALAQARTASYPESAVDAIPPALLAKYFTKVGSAFVFNKELRRSVIFGRHDIVHDAPISRVDLLSFRNTLMYFNAEAQTRVLNRLHFALNDDGLLFLGKAEMLLTHASIFTPLDLKLRIFARAKGRLRAVPKEAPPSPSDATTRDRSRLYRAAFERAPCAQLVLDPDDRVALFSPRAAHLFGLSAEDVDHPFQDLELSYRPVDLRSSLERARKERRPIYLRDVERLLPAGDTTYLDIELVPLLGEGGVVVGTQISFSDTTESRKLQTQLRKTNTELETAHEELQSTSEELETTNEELQSTVEELETTNEELQSTNEELETMNEELQSTNEELQAMNEELRQRGEELVEIGTFFSGVLGSMRFGVAVLDRDAIVRAWNPKMEDLWGLRSDEVEGKQLITLDIGLPVDQLVGPIRAGLSTGEATERTVECTNRRGRTIRCQMTVTPLKSEPIRGVTLVVEELS